MNRRTFVTACGVAAAAPGLSLTAASALAEPVRQDLPHLGGRFSAALFEAYRGETFQMYGKGFGSASMRLTEVRGESGSRHLEQFSLRFEPQGGEAPSEDGLYLLEHPKGGKIALSLQPASVDGRVHSLTASFSLMA